MTARAPTPFRIDVAQETLDWVRRRIAEYDWHEAPAGEGLEDSWAYGTNFNWLKDLCTYWHDVYDWRVHERALNRFSHFIAEIDGLPIHFIHEKGSQSRERPLLISHGWPGSIAEFLHVIEPLAHPERFGGDAEDGFDVVVPSLPGYGWSGKPKRPIGPRTAARHFDRLMADTLGYDPYLAQGGDWGSAITGWLGYEGRASAVHLNMFGWRAPGIAPETAEEKAFEQRFQAAFDAEGAYFRLQMTKPQTLSYAMMDSPVGVCAWICEKFHGWSDRARGFDAVYPRDVLLTNVMVYLVTRSFNTASWMYRGLIEDPGGPPLAAGTRIEKPVGVANFPHDFIGWPPRSLVARHMNVVRWTDMSEGGHFAAMEQPEKFIADIRAFARGAGL